MLIFKRQQYYHCSLSTTFICAVLSAFDGCIATLYYRVLHRTTILTFCLNVDRMLHIHVTFVKGTK